MKNKIITLVPKGDIIAYDINTRMSIKEYKKLSPSLKKVAEPIYAHYIIKYTKE